VDVRSATKRFKLNNQKQLFEFWLKIVSRVSMLVLTAIAFGGGAWLVSMGQSIQGVVLFLGALGTLIGAAIYGHNNGSMHRNRIKFSGGLRR
jgi:hypothetical protein